MAANSMELLASTRVMCAITSEYFRGLTAVGLSGHMIITRSGPLSDLTSHAASTAPLTISAAASSVRSILGIPSDLRIPCPSVFRIGLPEAAICCPQELIFGQQDAALSRCCDHAPQHSAALAF